jgi:hypothetical protein
MNATKTRDHITTGWTFTWDGTAWWGESHSHNVAVCGTPGCWDVVSQTGSTPEDADIAEHAMGVTRLQDACDKADSLISEYDGPDGPEAYF